MTYSLSTLICMVRTAMGLNKTQHPLIHCHDPDTADIDDMIALSIVPAAAEVLCRAPLSDIADTAKEIDTDAIYWHRPVEGTYSGHIFLPDDFLRLMTFEMSDWTRPVVDPIYDNSPRRSAFYSRYAPIAGTYSRPACLITDTSEGHCLIFRSCLSDTARVTHAKYIPRPYVAHGAISLPAALLHDIIEATVRITPRQDGSQR